MSSATNSRTSRQAPADIGHSNESAAAQAELSSYRSVGGHWHTNPIVWPRVLANPETQVATCTQITDNPASQRLPTGHAVGRPPEATHTSEIATAASTRQLRHGPRPCRQGENMKHQLTASSCRQDHVASHGRTSPLRGSEHAYLVDRSSLGSLFQPIPLHKAPAPHRHPSSPSLFPIPTPTPSPLHLFAYPPHSLSLPPIRLPTPPSPPQLTPSPPGPPSPRRLAARPWLSTRSS